MDAKFSTCSGLFLISRYLFQGMLSAAYIHVIFRFPINNGYRPTYAKIIRYIPELVGMSLGAVERSSEFDLSSPQRLPVLHRKFDIRPVLQPKHSVFPRP